MSRRKANAAGLVARERRNGLSHPRRWVVGPLVCGLGLGPSNKKKKIPIKIIKIRIRL